MPTGTAVLFFRGYPGIARIQTVKECAGENLVTVRGGVPGGDPCGGTHLHSYQGREELVVRSIISWIKTRKVDRLIGE
jgi:hypothetical protein